MPKYINQTIKKSSKYLNQILTALDEHVGILLLAANGLIVGHTLLAEELLNTVNLIKHSITEFTGTINMKSYAKNKTSASCLIKAKLLQIFFSILAEYENIDSKSIFMAVIKDNTPESKQSSLVESEILSNYTKDKCDVNARTITIAESQIASLRDKSKQTSTLQALTNGPQDDGLDNLHLLLPDIKK